MPDTPHFSYPFERGPNGRVRVVEQDTAAHELSRANVIVRCPLGFRDERPDFGWAWPEYRNLPLDLAPLDEAFARHGIVARAADFHVEAQLAVEQVNVDVEG